MKKLYSELPWEVIKDNTAGLYDKNGDCFLITDDNYSNVGVDYIIESANNYPKAIQLLQWVIESDTWNKGQYSIDISLDKQITEFLNEIENG